MNGGSGIWCEESSVNLENCTFYSHGGMGSTVHLEGSAELLSQNTIISFTDYGGAVHCDGASTATLTCCDVFGNVGGDWVGCIADQYGANGNISEDPGFCDAPQGDYHLWNYSPCAPEFNPDCGLIGAWAVGCWGTAAERTTWGGLKALFR